MNSQNNRMTTHINSLRKPKKPKMLVSISNSERTLINNKH